MRVYIKIIQIPHAGILDVWVIFYLSSLNFKIQGELLMENKNVCPGCQKKTMRTEEERRKLVNRLKRVEGQIRGIIGMLENDAYCNDILIQSAAVNAAVNAFNKELLASHIRTCVARDIREGKDETIDELVATLQKLMK